MTIKVQEHIREDASNPYEQGFDSLSAQAVAKWTATKFRMTLGNTFSLASLTHSLTASRVGWVISNWTGRDVFYCITVAWGETGSPWPMSRTRILTKSQIASSQFAVESQVERCEFTNAVSTLKPDSDRPNLFQFER